MEDLMADVKYDTAKIINEAVGPDEQFCMGYLTPGAKGGKGYIVTPKISVATADARNLDVATERVITHGLALRNEGYMGEVNMITTESGVCGLNGAIWGYDLAKHDDIASGKAEPLYQQALKQGQEIPVYDIQPLLESTNRLFGWEDQQRFPIMPGSPTLCAHKVITDHGAKWVWAAMAIGIPANRDFGSCIFVEDTGLYGNDNTDESQIIGYLKGTQRRLTETIARYGKEQNIEYGSIFVGFKYVFVEPEQVGCAMICLPYIYLAQNAIPEGMEAADLQNITLSEWEKALNLPPMED